MRSQVLWQAHDSQSLSLKSSTHFAWPWSMHYETYLFMLRPRGLMDKASDFESEDCEFESRRGRRTIFWWVG